MSAKSLPKWLVVAITSALICLCLLATLISPRFGYSFDAHQYGKYRYESTFFVDGKYTTTYRHSDEAAFTISYDNRFSLKLTIQHTGEQPFTATFFHDRGSTGLDVPTNSPLAWLMYEIIANDSSGNCYLIYLFPAAIILLSGTSILRLQKNKDSIFVSLLTPLKLICGILLPIIAFILAVRII